MPDDGRSQIPLPNSFPLSYSSRKSLIRPAQHSIFDDDPAGRRLNGAAVTDLFTTDAWIARRYDAEALSIGSKGRQQFRALFSIELTTALNIECHDAISGGTPVVGCGGRILDYSGKRVGVQNRNPTVLLGRLIRMTGT